MIRLTKSLLSFPLLVLFTCMLWTPGHAGTLYAVHHTTAQGDEILVTIDTTTFAITEVGSVGVEMGGGGLAYDPNSDTLYMVNGSRATASSLYTINRSTGLATLRGSTGVERVHGLAYDSTNDVLYATSVDSISADAALYTLDTGGSMGVLATLVGTTDGFSFTGLAYDSTNDKLIASGLNRFVEIDRNTGEQGQIIAGYFGSVGRGFAYDPDLDRFWDTDEAGSLYSYTQAFAPQMTHFLNVRPRLDALAYVSESGPLLCEIIDPVVATDDAISIINSNEGLDFGTTLTLVQKLEEAKDKLSLGDLHDARSKVFAFIGEIEAAVDDGALPPADANVLLNRAAGILTSIQFP